MVKITYVVVELWCVLMHLNVGVTSVGAQCTYSMHL